MLSHPVTASSRSLIPSLAPSLTPLLIPTLLPSPLSLPCSHPRLSLSFSLTHTHTHLHTRANRRLRPRLSPGSEATSFVGTFLQLPWNGAVFVLGMFVVVQGLVAAGWAAALSQVRSRGPSLPWKLSVKHLLLLLNGGGGRGEGLRAEARALIRAHCQAAGRLKHGCLPCLTPCLYPAYALASSTCDSCSAPS